MDRLAGRGEDLRALRRHRDAGDLRDHGPGMARASRIGRPLRDRPDEDRRRGRQRGRARRDRRDLSPAPGRRGAHLHLHRRRGQAPGRMGIARRHRLVRQGRLPVSGRSTLRPDPARRRQHLSGGGRGRDRLAPGGAIQRRHRTAGGRSGPARARDRAGPILHHGRGSFAAPRDAAGALQAADELRVRERAAARRCRQEPALGTAGSGCADAAFYSARRISASKNSRSSLPPDWRRCASALRRSVRRIFPDTVLGRSQNSTMRMRW